MQNLGLWGHVSHLLQKQHEKVFIIQNVGLWGGFSIYIYILMYMYVYIEIDTHTDTHTEMDDLYTPNNKYEPRHSCVYVYVLACNWCLPVTPPGSALIYYDSDQEQLMRASRLLS